MEFRALKKKKDDETVERNVALRLEGRVLCTDVPLASVAAESRRNTRVYHCWRGGREGVGGEEMDVKLHLELSSL